MTRAVIVDKRARPVNPLLSDEFFKLRHYRWGVRPDNAAIKLGLGTRFRFDLDRSCNGLGLCAAKRRRGAIDIVATAI
jgi:hypothetical protein